MANSSYITDLGYVIASKRIMENRLPIKFMYREQPDNDQDSGWRFFAGDEDQEYVDNPENMIICDIYSVLNIDKTIAKYLINTAVGTAYERKKRSEPFREIHDFDFDVPEKINDL